MTLREIVLRLRAWMHRDELTSELDAEIRDHVERLAQDFERDGMPRADALAAARRQLGNSTQVRENSRDAWGFPTLDSLMQDVRYAMRTLLRAPGFTATVIITLALGIGANTAIFSVVRGVLLKPLPHKDGGRLVYLRHSMDGPGGEDINFSVPEVRDLRNGAPSFSGIAEYSAFSMVYQSDAGAERIQVGLVTGNYFEVMGLSPVAGRLTLPSDDGPGAAPVVVLTNQYWVKRFGSDPAIVGKQVMFDRRSVQVIGVLQPAPFFPDRVDVLANMVNSPHHVSAQMVEGRQHRMTEVVGRLAQTASFEKVRGEIDAVQARLQQEYSEAYHAGSHHRFVVIPFHDALGDRARLTLWLLMGAAAFVMIISAANVANLSLMRGVRREQELVVRAALGSGVARLRRLLLVENLVLTLVGAALGAVIAVFGVKLLTSLAERYSPRANEIALDGWVLSFALVLSVMVALLLSFLASLPKETGLASRIISGANRMSATLSRGRLQRGLVVVQVAVSAMLLFGSGLLTRTMIRLSETETGLKSEEVLTMRVSLLTQAENRDPALVAAALERLRQMRQEISALPGVIDVGNGAPVLQGGGGGPAFHMEGRVVEENEITPRAEARSASPTYFKAAGITLLEGREFTETDSNVVIINKVFADRYYPKGDAIGRRISLVNVVPGSPQVDQWRTIVGVVARTQDGGLDAGPLNVMFLPQPIGGSFVIHADKNVATLAPAVTKIVRRIAPTSLIENVLTVQQIKDQSIAPRRLNAALVSSFGILAVLIAAVGIAGVLGFSVSARTNEIGIRMSLGADGGKVQRMILWEGGSLVAAGLALGVGGSLLASQAIQGLLFGVAPHDPVTFIGVIVLMGTIGVVACWIPAIRAARIDPAITMRA